MRKKLSKALQALIKAYIDGRDNQRTVRWDKQACLEAIDKQAFADGFTRVEACCGTWWFSKPWGKQRYMWAFEANEENYTTALKGTRTTSSNALSKLLSV